MHAQVKQPVSLLSLSKQAPKNNKEEFFFCNPKTEHKYKEACRTETNRDACFLPLPIPRCDTDQTVLNITPIPVLASSATKSHLLHSQAPYLGWMSTSSTRVCIVITSIRLQWNRATFSTFRYVKHRTIRERRKLRVWKTPVKITNCVLSSGLLLYRVQEA